jgi:hypothetical protein
MFLFFCSNKYAAEEHSLSEIARVSAQMNTRTRREVYDPHLTVGVAANLKTTLWRGLLRSSHPVQSRAFCRNGICSTGNVSDLRPSPV